MAKAPQKPKAPRKGRRPRKPLAIIDPDDLQVCCVGGSRLREAMEEALTDREHVIMCRVHEGTLASIDMLVEAGLADSRSSAAAFLIQEGIKADAPLFVRIKDVTTKIAALKNELRRLVEPAEREDPPKAS